MLAASSLNHALETLTSEEKNFPKEQVYSIPGLNLNTNRKISKKTVQNLLSVEVIGKNNVVVWHDVIKNNFSGHKSSRFRSLSVPELLAILNQLENRLRALVYSQRGRTPNNAESKKNWVLLPCTLRKILSHLENKKTNILWNNSLHYTRVLSLNSNILIGHCNEHRIQGKTHTRGR